MRASVVGSSQFMLAVAIDQVPFAAWGTPLG